MINKELSTIIKEYSKNDIEEIKPYLDSVQEIIDSQDELGLSKVIEELLKILKKKGDLLYSLSKGKHEPVYVHSIDVKNLAYKFTEYLKNLDPAKLPVSIKNEIGIISLDDIAKEAVLHDLGKIAIPSRILLKESKLTEDEEEIIKLHPIVGDYLVSQIDCLKNITGGIRYHHEYYAGGRNRVGLGSYPGELKGKEIPLGARIISIWDDYDALTSERCYREKLTPQEAVEELKEWREKKFDPDIFDLFLDYFNTKLQFNKKKKKKKL